MTHTDTARPLHGSADEVIANHMAELRGLDADAFIYMLFERAAYYRAMVELYGRVLDKVDLLLGKAGDLATDEDAISGERRCLNEDSERPLPLLALDGTGRRGS